MSKLNLPNKLTIMRLLLVPVFMVIMLIPPLFGMTQSGVGYIVCNIVGLLVFLAASITDMLDGKIARKYNLITDFGKFLDPLADKFMVIGAMMCIFYSSTVYGNVYLSAMYIIALIIVVFRELAVTSVRLVASSSGGVVIAANKLGKIKTVTQIIALVTAIVEPLIYGLISPIRFLLDYLPLTVITTVLMSFMTILSGINYIKGAWKYLDPEK